ncbi:MAG: STAS domain-containing protein [Veillonella sp.]|nr:STAS domain-containing protein [Veillonella sp.]
MFAIQKAYQSGTLGPSQWGQNLVAGLVVGVVALPLAMAFAIASGVPPQAGIYTSIVAGLIVAIFGGSPVQIAGPTGAFVVLLSDIVAQYGLEGLQIATILGGLILVLMSLAKLGKVIRFIPSPVITGFTAGIGVTIFVGQWSYFFGVPNATGAHFHEKVWQLLQAIPHFHMATLGLGLLSLAIILLWPRIPLVRRAPAPIVAMLVATILQALYHFEGVATIGSAFGGIPQGLMTPTLPDVTWGKVMSLIGPAFTIAMLGAIESLLSAVVADGMSGTKHDSNRELLGQGLANVVAPLLGGIAATGAIARTATNIKNGGTSPIAGIVHALVLVLILLFLAPYAKYIPLASMAAILFVVAYNMSDLRRFFKIIRLAPRVDVAVLLITFFLTIFTDLVIAVNIGVVLSILFFMRRIVGTIDVHEVTNEELQKEIDLDRKIHPEIMVYTMEGPLFFGAVSAFENALRTIHGEPKYLIIRFADVPFVDLTGLRFLMDSINDLKAKGIEVYLSDMKYDIRRQMYKLDYHNHMGRHHVWRTTHSALSYAEKQLDKQAAAKIEKNR